MTSQVWHYISHYSNVHIVKWVVVLAVSTMMATGSGCIGGVLYVWYIHLSPPVTLFDKDFVNNMGFNEVHNNKI